MGEERKKWRNMSGINLISSQSSIFILQLSGGLQIFFGATFAWNHLSYSLVLGSNFWVPSVVLLCLGPITYALCWLGWNAISKQNKQFLRIVSETRWKMKFVCEIENLYIFHTSFAIAYIHLNKITTWFINIFCLFYFSSRRYWWY